MPSFLWLSFLLLPLTKFVSSFFSSKNGTIFRLTKCSPSTNAMNALLLLFLTVGNGVIVNILFPENCRDHSRSFNLFHLLLVSAENKNICLLKILENNISSSCDAQNLVSRIKQPMYCSNFFVLNKLI